jgi:Helix-turn-helix domain
MAYIPDEAIDRMHAELSRGAAALYVFLARCRNQNTGKCFPSVTLTMEAINVNRATVFALRKELTEKKWATFEGDNVTFLYGFNSLKNQTKSKENKRDIGKSLKNQTQIEKSEKSDSQSLKNQTIDEASKEDNNDCLITGVDYQTQSMNNQTVHIDSKRLIRELTQNAQEIAEVASSLKNHTTQSEKSDSESEKSDCYIGRTSKYEPANITSKDYMSNSASPPSTDAGPESPPEKIDSRTADVRQVFDHWKTRLNHPKARLDEKRKRAVRGRLADGFSVEDLKTAIDGCRSSPFHQGGNDRGQVYDSLTLICRDAEHVERFIGYVANSNNGNHANGVTRYEPTRQKITETQGARRARETLEYLGGLRKAEDGHSGVDPDDSTPTWIGDA